MPAGEISQLEGQRLHPVAIASQALMAWLAGLSACRCLARYHGCWLQKSLSPNPGQTGGNSREISKGFFRSGMCKFESSEVSQAAGRPGDFALNNLRNARQWLYQDTSLKGRW
jgi:hypothetical protein